MRAGTFAPSPMAVGADGEPLVGEYDSSHGPPQASGAVGLPGPPVPLRLRPRRGPHGAVALLVVLAVVAGLVTHHLIASGPAGRALRPRRRAAQRECCSLRPARHPWCAPC